MRQHSGLVLLGLGVWLMACGAEAEDAQRRQPLPRETSVGEAFSVNEPVYFVVGGGEEPKARFQLSFRYRIFDEDSGIVANAGWLKGLHFAYTQTSLWNLGADSAPFEDSSYRPSLFYDVYTNSGNGFLPKFIRTGYEHESNGQDGETSRSIDTAVFWPMWGGRSGRYQWAVAPKFYAYLATGAHNADIDEYRGYVDLWLHYGRVEGWAVSTVLRLGEDQREMVELDFSWPIRENSRARTGGYLYLQLFHGYGQTLLSYDEEVDTQVRVGFAVVR